MALFLDVDGTLLELASRPDAVVVPLKLCHMLKRLARQQEGALALISGRSIETLDRLFRPIRFSASGLHGFERRGASRKLLRAPMDHAVLGPARRKLAAYVAGRSGLLLEDKGWTIAVHFRNAREHEPELRRLMESITAMLAPQFKLVRGKCVLEIAPGPYSKGAAIQQFMCEHPFVSRVPVFVGDDVTDEHGFEAVNALGGYSVRVGDDVGRSAALYRIPDVTSVKEWLSELAR